MWPYRADTGRSRFRSELTCVTRLACCASFKAVNATTCRILVASATFIPWNAAAQSPLTVETAVRTALAHNASLRAARAGADEAVAHATEARSGFFPRLSVTESWQRGDQPAFVFSSLLSARRFTAADFAIDALNHPDPIGFFRTSLVVEQSVFDGGRQRAAAATAALTKDIASTSVDQAAAGIAVATTQTYGRIVSAEAAKRAADAGAAVAREDHTRAEHRRDAGLATDGDVLSLVVHVADLEQRAIQAQSDAVAARAELNRLMGTAIDAEVHVVEPISGTLAEFGEEFHVSALLAEADAARPELKRAAAASGIAERGWTQARSALVPQVAAQGAFEVSGTQFAERASSWIVGGELRWTFSTGGAELAALRAAGASMARATAEADATRAAVHVDVVTAVGRIQAARAREAAGRAAVDEARESQRITRNRYEQGIASVSDVLRASSALLDAEMNRVTALVEGLVATADLHRALGRAP